MSIYKAFAIIKPAFVWCDASMKAPEWADVIYVMEPVHRRKLSSRFQRYLKNKKIVCLNIPDEFEYMDPELVAILNAKLGHLFR